MLYGLFYLFFTSTIQAATSPCLDEFSATKCSNELDDVICQEAFPVSEALLVSILIFLSTYIFKYLYKVNFYDLLYFSK